MKEIIIDGNDWLPTPLRAFCDPAIEGLDYIRVSEADCSHLVRLSKDKEWTTKRAAASKASKNTPEGKANSIRANTEVNSRPEVKAKLSAAAKRAALTRQPMQYFISAAKRLKRPFCVLESNGV